MFSKEILRVTLGSQLNPVRVRTSQIEAPLIVPSSEVEAGCRSASDLNCRLCIPGTRLRNGELLPQKSRNDGICHASNQAVAEIVIKIHTRRLDKGRARIGQQYSYLCRVSRPSRGLLDWLDCQETCFSDRGRNGFQAANNPNLGCKDGATRALRFD